MVSLKCPAACSPLAHTDLSALPAPAGHFSSSSSACGRSPSAAALVPAWAGEGLIPGPASFCGLALLTPQPALHYGIILISSSCSPRGKALVMPALSRKCHSPESITAQGYKTAENMLSLGWWSLQALVVAGRSWTQRQDAGIRMYVNARQWQIRNFRASLGGSYTSATCAEQWGYGIVLDSNAVFSVTSWKHQRDEPSALDPVRKT